MLDVSVFADTSRATSLQGRPPCGNSLVFSYVLSAFELRSVDPHTVHDDGEFPFQSDLGTFGTTAYCHPHCPGLERRPLRRSLHHYMRGLVKSAAKSEKELNKGVQSPVSKIKGYFEYCTAELLHGPIPSGVAATKHPRGLIQIELAAVHYAEHPSAIIDQERLAKHYAKLHWSLAKESNSAAYLAGLEQLEKSQRPRRKPALQEV